MLYVDSNLSSVLNLEGNIAHGLRTQTLESASWQITVLPLTSL